eukprot:IDg7704t1
MVENFSENVRASSMKERNFMHSRERLSFCHESLSSSEVLRVAEQLAVRATVERIPPKGMPRVSGGLSEGRAKRISGYKISASVWGIRSSTKVL